MKNPKLLGGLCLALLLSLSARAQPNWQWAQQHGGTDTFVDTTRLAVDAAGNSHVTGHFSGTATFGSTTFTSAGNKDLFVAKVDTNGNLLWARTASGAEIYEATARMRTTSQFPRIRLPVRR